MLPCARLEVEKDDSIDSNLTNHQRNMTIKGQKTEPNELLASFGISISLSIC